MHLDGSSEWATRTTAFVLLREGKLAEARESIQKTSAQPLMGRELLVTCLDASQAANLNTVAQRAESAALSSHDPEPRYFIASLLAYCGQKDAALRLLRSASQQNYCAYTALQTDPLFSKLRSDADFVQVRSAAKECQDNFLKGRNQAVQ